MPNANPCEKPSGMWSLHSEMVCCHIYMDIYGQAQRSMPGILRKFNQYLCAPSFPGQGTTDFQKRKGKAIKWGRRKAGVGREANLLSCCGWVAGAGGRQGSADISGPGSRKAPTHPPIRRGPVQSHCHLLAILDTSLEWWLC